MKAPEKIYLQACGDCKDNDCENCKFEDLEEITWCRDKIFEKDIEYTRTDSFIEKACAWFRTLDDKEPPYTTTEEFIEGFKKAMKL